MLRLKNIQITNIRSIGAGKEGGPGIRLADLADVNVISAPNGVGKTSIIEAIMLGLTGEPRRRGRNIGLNTFLHRAADPPGHASVSLEFSGDQTLGWNWARPTGESSESPRDDDAHLRKMMNLLAAVPSSTDVVTNLLRLTHILPQGWGERFGDHSGADRWSLVEKALEIGDVRAKISSGNKRGSVGRRFTKELGSLETKIKDAERIADEMLRFRDEWSALNQSAASQGALSPADCQEILKQIVDDFDLSLSRLTPALLRGEIQGWLRERIGRFEALTAKVAERTGIQASLSGEKIVYNELDEKLPEMKRDLRALEKTVTSMKGASAHEKRPERLAAYERAHDIYQASMVFNDLQVYSRLEVDIETAKKRLFPADVRSIEDDEIIQKQNVRKENQTQIVSLESQLGQIQHLYEGLQRALHDITPFVNDDTEKCPVCSSQFQQGELRERLAYNIEDDINEKFVPIHNEINALRAAQADFDVQLEASKTKLYERIEQDRVAQARMTELNAEIRKIRLRYPSIQQDDSLSLHHFYDSLNTYFNALGQPAPPSITVARGDLDSLKHDLEQCDYDITQSKDLSVPLEGAPPLSIVEAQIKSGEDTLRVETQRFEASRVRLTAWEEKLETVERGIAEGLLEGADDVPAAMLEANLAAWRKSAIEKVARANERLSYVEAGLKVYSDDVVLNRFIDRVLGFVNQSGLPSPELVNIEWFEENAEIARKQISTRMNEHEAFKSLEKKFSNTRTTLTEELKSYENECLGALSPDVNRYMKTLAPTFAWNLELRRFKNDARPQVSHRSSPMGTPSEDVEWGDVFSAGESTAVALAYLLAFHTKYRWSNWPALILDDPFQSSDVVRAGALLDVLRNLSSTLGTQIIMTTHDPELADWATRKMRWQGLETRHYRLMRSAAGIDVQIE